MRINILIVIMLITGICLMIPTKGISCPIPVFRYALEFWEADPYIIEIYYQNSLDRADKDLVDILLMASRGGNTKANLEIRNFDVESDIDETTRGYINGIPSGDYPWMVLRYPSVSGINQVIWSGPLNRAGVDLMLNSPARENISRKLVHNATAVWVLLESGNKQKDREALDILNIELRRLEQTLVLPELDSWLDSSQAENHGELSVINFETISISRDDLLEEYFVRMLTNSEDDLIQFASEPIVFPFYGRGRALWAIVGGGINQWNIREAAEFLTGPCSCQAKLLNPGVDMLMAMGWDNVVDHITDISIANPLSGLGDFGNRETEVIRLLKEATNKRLGTGTRQAERQDIDLERVTYLDICADTEQQDQKAPAKANIGGADKGVAMSTEASATAKSSSGSAFTDRSSKARQASKAAIDQSTKNTDFMSFITLIFAGIILAILALSVVLYWKRIK